MYIFVDRDLSVRRRTPNATAFNDQTFCKKTNKQLLLTYTQFLHTHTHIHIKYRPLYSPKAKITQNQQYILYIYYVAVLITSFVDLHHVTCSYQN